MWPWAPCPGSQGWSDRGPGPAPTRSSPRHSVAASPPPPLPPHSAELARGHQSWGLVETEQRPAAGPGSGAPSPLGPQRSPTGAVGWKASARLPGWRTFKETANKSRAALGLLLPHWPPRTRLASASPKENKPFFFSESSLENETPIPPCPPFSAQAPGHTLMVWKRGGTAIFDSSVPVTVCGPSAVGLK